MQKDWMVSLVMLLLLAVFVFLLFQVTGGDWTAWLDAGQPGRQSDSILGGLTNGLRSIGDGIGDVFRRAAP